jgi:nitrogen fixation protein FixH
MESIQHRNKARIWPRPEIVPVPEGRDEYVVDLNGNWKFTDVPGPDDWENGRDCAGWDEVPVPGDLVALGYDVRSDREMVYRRQVTLPEYGEGKRILLKINRAGEYCKIWVDGRFIREHRGGYTAFDCDLSGVLQPGKPSWITVLCMETSDCLAGWVRPSGSPAHAGMMGDVQLLVLPEDYLARLQYETDLDEQHCNATLKVTAAIAFHKADHAVVRLKLLDPSGSPVPLETAVIPLDRDVAENTIEIPVKAPLKWDAEHPWLYTLTAEVEADGGPVLSYRRRVGFRKLVKKGNALYVNGNLTKLRGIARYSHDPVNGKVFTDEQIETELRLVKDANINFIRLSVYPEKEKYMELCDVLGIYLQVCTPVTFQQERYDSLGFPVYRHTCGKPAYLAAFMEQFAEMIELFRSHPSILLWEFANESDWGVNLKTEIDYARQEDPGRLTSGSWGNEYADLFCYHYPQYNEVYTNAALYDEYIHIATHAMGTLRRDPAIRNAWGLSLNKGWDTLYDADGVVGTAIFALGDFVLLHGDGRISAAEYGQWGILDPWLRKKPEWWLTKKGYSPVKIHEGPLAHPGPGRPLEVPVRNRFNSTDFKELKFYWDVNQESGCIEGYGLAPREKGALIIPVKELKSGDVVHLSACDAYGRFIDAVALKIRKDDPETGSLEVDDPKTGDPERGSPKAGASETDDPAHRDVTCGNRPLYVPVPSVKEDGESVTVYGNDYSVVFSRATGLIVRGDFKGSTLLKGGPYLNFNGLYYKATAWPRDNTGDFTLDCAGWALEAMSTETGSEEVRVHISGSYPSGTHLDRDGNSYGYGAVKVRFTVGIDGSGLITTKYTVDTPPQYLCCEAGVSYVLTERIDRLAWDRDALYSVYPDDHIGRPAGIACRNRGCGTEKYREKPQWSWALDEKEYVLNGAGDPGGRGTRDFRSSREKIRFLSAVASGSENRVRVESDGKSLSVRAEVLFPKEQRTFDAAVPQPDEQGLPGPVKLNMNHVLYYELGSGSLPGHIGDRAWGNYTYPEVHLQPGYTREVRMRMTDRDERVETGRVGREGSPATHKNEMPVADRVETGRCRNE